MENLLHKNEKSEYIHEVWTVVIINLTNKLNSDITKKKKKQ